jgi:hypothetical protein
MKKPKALSIKDAEDFNLKVSELGDSEEDNDGQVVVYTGVYRWNDGKLRYESEAEWDGEDE